MQPNRTAHEVVWNTFRSHVRLYFYWPLPDLANWLFCKANLGNFALFDHQIFFFRFLRSASFRRVFFFCVLLLIDPSIWSSVKAFWRKTDKLMRRSAKKRQCFLGRDLLAQLPLDIEFFDKTILWQEITIPMKLVDRQAMLWNRASPRSSSKNNGKSRYELWKSRLTCNYIKMYLYFKGRRAALLRLLIRYEGTLGAWNGREIA